MYCSAVTKLAQCSLSISVKKESSLAQCLKSLLVLKQSLLLISLRLWLKKYGVELRNVLTGFKFIGEQIGFLEKTVKITAISSDLKRAMDIFAGSYVRDKDAVVASMLICEMAAFYRTKGISLLEAREKMYKTYGNYVHSQSSFTCEGASGMERMKELMSMLRTDTLRRSADLRLFHLLTIWHLKKLALNAVKRLLLPFQNLMFWHLILNRAQALSFVHQAQSQRSKHIIQQSVKQRKLLQSFVIRLPMTLSQFSVSD